MTKKITIACIIIIFGVLIVTLIYSCIDSLYKIWCCKKKKNFRIGITPSADLPNERLSNQRNSLKIFDMLNSTIIPKVSAKNSIEIPVHNSFCSIDDIN